MAERVFDADNVTCFRDDDGVIGWQDDFGNWIGYKFEADDKQCIPDGLNNFTCKFS